MDREYGKVDVQVELKFLTDDICLPKRQGHEAVPRYKEVLSLAQSEGLDRVSS